MGTRPTFAGAFRFGAKPGFIRFGAPYIERLRHEVKLTATLSAIAAAVVGAVLNLAAWFGMRTLFADDGGVHWFAVAVGSMALLGQWRWKWGVVPVVIGSGAPGLIHHVATR